MKNFLYNIQTIFKRVSIFLFMLLLIFSSKESFAQLSGFYTIGSGGIYSTFTAAVSDLNSQGVGGAVTFNVITGTYTEQFAIGNISGSSASNTVTFQSQSGIAADVTIQYTATSTGDNYIAQLNGTDYVTFQYMTFTAWGTSYGRIFQINAGSNNVSISNCIFNGVSTTSSSTNVAIIFSTTSTSNSDNMNITNNTFNDGGYSIYLHGVNTTTLASGTEIIGHTLNNVAYGMNLLYHQDMIVSGNTVQATQTYGIYVQYGDGAMEITKNQVSTGSGYGIYLYTCDGGVIPTGTPGLVANNFVTSNANTTYGIYIYSSNRQNVYYNSVNSLSGTNSRSFETIYGSDINVVNNIFANHGGGYAYVVNTPSAIVTSNYNNIYSAGNYVAYWGTSNITDLAALQAASGKDANSISVNPQFISNTNLHTTTAEIDSAATPLVEVTDDIDGELRDGLFPDIGADEFIFGFNYSPVITSLPDTTAMVDSLYEYQVTATDLNGDTLTYQLLIAPTFLSIDTTTGLIQGTPAQGDVGDHAVSIEADDGNGGTTNQLFTLHVQPPLGINEFTNQIPKEFALKQNYPNPFNPTTTIEYDLPKAAQVKIEIYNLLGKRIKIVLDSYKNVGSHKFVFDANNLASGVYLYRIEAGTYTNSKKMILLR